MTTNDRITVMSANLWNLNEPLAERMGRFSDIIEAYRPDVIAMQEVRPLPGSGARLQLELVPALADYRIHFDVATAWNGGAEGLAVATLTPVIETRCYRLPDGEPDFEPTRAVQYVRIPWAGGFLGICNTHLAYHPDSEALRLAQATFVAESARDLGDLRPDDALVVCGDLNATPDSAAVATLRDIGGLANPWLGLAENKRSFSIANPFNLDDEDVWLDYILVRGANCTATRLLDDWPAGPASDHHFVLLEIEAPRACGLSSPSGARRAVSGYGEGSWIHPGCPAGA